MFAVITERLGSLLNDDFAPSVAASLQSTQNILAATEFSETHHNRPNPLSRRDSNSGEKNMVGQDRGSGQWADHKDERRS